VEVVKTEQPIAIRETRRFSETIAIDHGAKLRETALQFRLPTREKSEYIVRRESLPKGMKLEVRVRAPAAPSLLTYCQAYLLLNVARCFEETDWAFVFSHKYSFFKANAAQPGVSETVTILKAEIVVSWVLQSL